MPKVGDKITQNSILSNNFDNHQTLHSNCYKLIIKSSAISLHIVS